MFWISTPIWMYLQCISLIKQVVFFSVVDGFLYCVEGLQLDVVPFVIFVLLSLAGGDRSEKNTAKINFKCALPMFSSRNFMVSNITYESLINFEFILYMMGQDGLVSLIVAVYFLNTIYWPRLSFFLMVYSCLFCHRLFDHLCVCLFLGYLFCFIDLCIFMLAT